MNICIDIGNTLIKTAIYDNDACIHSAVYESFAEEDIRNLCNQFDLKKGIISSVRSADFAILRTLEKVLDNLIILNSETRVPIKNEYQTPQTLGKDRLAAVVGANFLYPKKNILVIDAGSAITFDLITSEAEYKGGNIAPGLTMRFKALHEFTSKLPLLNPSDDVPFIGRNTTEAIISGVQNSLIFETDTYINELSRVYTGLVTIVTGGDAMFFDNKLKNTIFVVPNLVLTGLNRILNFNA